MLQARRHGKVPGTTVAQFTPDTVKKLETQMNARNIRENSAAMLRAVTVMGAIGYYMSKASQPADRKSILKNELGANYRITTRCWESSHDGLIRVGLKIRFRTGEEVHEPEIVRAKFNSAKSNSMLLKGGENARTEVLIWNRSAPEAKEGLLEPSFQKVANKIFEMARRVAQHEVNKAIANHLAAKHGGHVKDVLLIPSRGICVLEDMVKVRNEGSRILFLVGGKYTESLQGAVDLAISSFEEKYFPESAQGGVQPGKDKPGIARQNTENTGGRADGFANRISGAKEYVFSLLF